MAMVIIIMGGVHAYLFNRLALATEIPGPLASVIGVALLVVVVSIPLSFVVSRILDKSVARYFVVPLYVWLGFVFQLFFLVLVLDSGRFVGGFLLDALAVASPFPDPDAALFAWRLTAGSAVALTALATASAIWWGLTRLKVKTVEVTLGKLPDALDGFRILQLSDLHLDHVRGRRWLKTVVERARSLGPDLIAITGDLAEGSVRQFSRDLEPLEGLEAPHGVYFVTGNHEYFHDLDGWLRFLDSQDIRVLRNERVPIGGPDLGFDLAGIDDHDGGRIAPGHGPDLEAALKGRDPSRVVVLLAHQPRVVHDASEAGVDLVLSGHTHGGQIWPFSYLVFLQQPYLKGLVNHRGTYLYISSGTGFWGPPMRLGTTAEMTMITLRSASP
jgi:predicted MPP superfamily phosphohydrolase